MCTEEIDSHKLLRLKYKARCGQLTIYIFSIGKCCVISIMALHMNVVTTFAFRAELAQEEKWLSVQIKVV